MRKPVLTFTAIAVLLLLAYAAIADEPAPTKVIDDTAAAQPAT
jgi:hypothetical protein